MNLIILGPQGSGKGTQAELLASQKHLLYLGMGKMLRQEVEKKTAIGQQIADLINHGLLVPDELTIEVLRPYLTPANLHQGLIFDGFPRRLSQAKLLTEELAKLGTQIDKVIFLRLSSQESLRRLSGRRSCPVCGRLFNLLTMPPQNDELCDDCRVKLTIREDETPEAIKQRLLISEKETPSLLEYYRQQKILIEINGEQTVEEIFKDILEKLS